MKLRPIVTRAASASAFAFTSLAGALLVAAAPAAASGSAPVPLPAPLAGCWRAVGGEAGSGEQWSAPAGGTMLGTSRTVKGGRTVEHEFMQFRHDEHGRLVFVALPSGQKLTTFTLAHASDREWVFENPAHDFPQRVIYRLASPDELVARIEGQRRGPLPERALGPVRGRDFPFRREACANPGALQ